MFPSFVGLLRAPRPPSSCPIGCVFLLSPEPSPLDCCVICLERHQCCQCSCSGSACAITALDCLDPAANDELYDCKPTPPDTLPCSADVQWTWLVENSAGAQALAAAVNCSGGSFEVEWSGHIVIDQAIYIADGTVLTVRGDGSTAVVDGNGSTRLFTVINATLHVSGVNITSGTSTAGGAIAASGASVTLNRTSLIGNRATGNAGAVYISDGSSLSCSDASFFDNRSDFDGGAVYAKGNSAVLCGGSWLNNTAGVRGGALGAIDGSTVSWGEEAIFSENTAGVNGGALFISNNSTLAWSASSTFFANSAIFAGGALNVISSKVSWTGEVNSLFNENKALFGGALYFDNSHLSCSETTNSTFARNLATNAGGAAVVGFGSSAVFGGMTLFDGNIAAGIPDAFESGFGGAVAVADGSSVAWHRDLNFTGNSAEKVAGALYVADSSASWRGSTHFAGNIAGLSGGALFLWNGSYVDWTGNTHFTSNEAGADGGAVGSPVFDSDYNLLSSKLVVNGSTAFVNNTSGANGGALSLFGGLSVSIVGRNVVFLGNEAEDAGGAIYVSGTGVGPVFADVRFISNSAQVGGAASIVASGTLKQVADILSPDPTIFDRCIFIDNRATATGGAIESAGGQDFILNSVFEGNRAGAGGALRLAGMTSVDNCSFVENASDHGEGAAVSNIGSLSSMANLSFIGNAFYCQQYTFLDLQVSFSS